MTTKKLSLCDGIEEAAAFYSYSMPKERKTERRKRMESLLKRAVKYELTERQKNCITYYYFERRTVEEIAQLMGIKPTTVYKHLKAARHALKKCIIYL